MAFKGIQMGLGLLVIVAMLSGGAKAQSGCTSVLMTLSPCVNYITGNSSTPSSSCCSQLTNVVKTQPQCLCAAINGGSGAAASLGININQTLALQLPGVCNVQTPSVSQCNAASGPTSLAVAPATSPTISPSGSSDDTPTTDTPTTDTPTTDTPTTDTPSGGAGSKTVPSTDGSSNDGSFTKSHLHFMFFFLFIISCAFN